MSGMTPWQIGLGPVFAYERVAASRRWQGYALRSTVSVSVLLLGLVSIWMNTDRKNHASAIRYLAELGEGYFLAVILNPAHAGATGGGPAATAGASICLDRARGTLTHMLVTDLSAAEIVLGKLAARLLPVLSLLACTLPVLELLSLLGGVEPTSLRGGIVVTAERRGARVFAGDDTVALGGQDA